MDNIKIKLQIFGVNFGVKNLQQEKSGFYYIGSPGGLSAIQSAAKEQGILPADLARNPVTVEGLATYVQYETAGKKPQILYVENAKAISELKYNIDKAMNLSPEEVYQILAKTHVTGLMQIVEDAEMELIESKLSFFVNPPENTRRIN